MQKILAPCLKNTMSGKTIWTSLTAKEVKLFNHKVVCWHCPPGMRIFLEGEVSKGLYFVESGLVAIRKIDRHGRLSLIRLVGKGDALGYRSLLTSHPHNMSSDIIQASIICFINSRTVRSFLNNNHAFCLRFLECTANTLGEAEDRLYQISALNVISRFIHLLHQYRDQWSIYSENNLVIIRIPINREDIAAMIGAHPDSISRAIRQLESKGLIRVDGRQVQIENYNLLTEEFDTAQGNQPPPN